MHLDQQTSAAVLAEFGALRSQVTGVRGAVLAAVDGLLLVSDAPSGVDPHDVAAMAATTVGLSRQVSRALRNGPFQECTTRATDGWFCVYGVGEEGVLAVLADTGLNLARMHLEARAVAGRLAAVMPLAQNPELPPRHESGLQTAHT